MDVSIRPYRPSDAAAALDLWMEGIGERYPLTEVVLRQCLEGDPSGRVGDAVLAEAGNRLIGFAYMTLQRQPEPELDSYRDRAHLQAVVVAPFARRSGIGRRLVGTLIAAAAGEGRTIVEAGSGFFYLWPGIPEDLAEAGPFFAALGLDAEGTTHDLRGVPRADALDDRAAEALDTAGLTLDHATGGDRDALLRYLYQEFGGEWWHDMGWWFDQGMRPERVLLLRDRDGAIRGHARLHRSFDRPLGPPLFWARQLAAPSGGIGPIGVARAVRGRGVGRALLLAALVELHQSGVRDAIIDFTERLDFYGQFQFIPWRTFRHASAPIEDVLEATAMASNAR